MSKRTQEEFDREVKELVGDEYVFLDKYVNSNVALRVKHVSCGCIFKSRPYNFLKRNKRCPNCRKAVNYKRNFTNEDFLEKVKDLYGNEYTFLEEYVNTGTKLKVRHNICKNEYEVAPCNFFQGYKCPYCSKHKKKTTESFKKEVKELVGEEYSVLGEYSNNKQKLKMRHNKCNKIFEMRPNDFLYGHRCPYCQSLLPHGSVGIQIIRKYLDENNYYYKEEFTDKRCKYKKVLRFDFMLFDEDYNPLIAIEFDGKQHFQKTFNSETKFKAQQIRDSIKNEFCEKNGIEMIRISYKEIENIKEILDKSLTTSKS